MNSTDNIPPNLTTSEQATSVVKQTLKRQPSFLNNNIISCSKYNKDNCVTCNDGIIDKISFNSVNYYIKKNCIWGIW